MMPMKKDRKHEELSEQEILNQRVDAMLDPRRSGQTTPKKDETPPLDIFKDVPPDLAKNAKTAPEVSGALLENIGATVEKESTPSQPQPTQDSPRDPVGQQDPLDDPATDKAVEDIATKEGNTLLALQDAIGHKASRLAGRLAQEDKNAASRRRWAWIVFVVLFVLFVLLALPLNTYTCRWPVGIRLSVTTAIVPSVCK